MTKRKASKKKRQKANATKAKPILKTLHKLLTNKISIDNNTATLIVAIVSLFVAFSTLEVANSSYLQQEPYIVRANAYCPYESSGFEVTQSFSLIDVGKSVGYVNISTTSSNLTYIYITPQNSTVIAPSSPTAVQFYGTIKNVNVSQYQYSIKVNATGGNFGNDFHWCGVLTCKYKNNDTYEPAINSHYVIQNSSGWGSC